MSNYHFKCNICHNRHHILYTLIHENTQFISRVSWVANFCVRKIRFSCSANKSKFARFIFFLKKLGLPINCNWRPRSNANFNWTHILRNVHQVINVCTVFGTFRRSRFTVHLQFWCSYLIFLWTMRNVFECSTKFICTFVLRNVHQVNSEEWSNFKVFTRARLDSRFEDCAPSVTMNRGERSECLNSARHKTGK